MKKAANILNTIFMIFDIIIAVIFLVFALMFITSFDALVQAVIETSEIDIEFAKQTAITLIVVCFVFMSIFCLPIIFIMIARNKIKKAKCRQDLLAISILNIIFLNLPGGICMILIPDEEFKN